MEVSEYTTVRITKRLHEQVKRWAELDGRNLEGAVSRLIIFALNNYPAENAPAQAASDGCLNNSLQNPESVGA